MHLAIVDQPGREHTGGGGYRKGYGPHGTCIDKASFRQSSETGKGIQMRELKELLGFVGGRVGGNKSASQAWFADGVDMDNFFEFGEGCPGPWPLTWGHRSPEKSATCRPLLLLGPMLDCLMSS